MSVLAEVDLEERLVSIFHDVFQIEPTIDIEHLTQDAVAEWDSFAHLRLILELEQIFEISIADEDAVNMSSFLEIKDFISNKLI